MKVKYNITLCTGSNVYPITHFSIGKDSCEVEYNVKGVEPKAELFDFDDKTLPEALKQLVKRYGSTYTFDISVKIEKLYAVKVQRLKSNGSKSYGYGYIRLEDDIIRYGFDIGNSTKFPLSDAVEILKRVTEDKSDKNAVIMEVGIVEWKDDV